MPARPPLPQSVIEAFNELAQEQRGYPEHAMLNAQHIMGGGVLSHAIEHIGDLTNRMAQRTLVEYVGNAGIEYVYSKVRSVLRTLRNKYGFEREFRENLVANKVRVSDAVTALKHYADAHARLKVYNPTQWVARESAVALGRLDFARAERLLTVLERRLVDEDTWWDAATQYKLDRDGKPMVFVMRREKN